MTKSLPPQSLVLYADDDIDDRALIRESFESYSQSIRLLTFKDGIELLQYAASLHALDPLPCLIILDINMPRLNGKKVLVELRNDPNYMEVPIVLFSTSTLPSEAAFAKSFNAGFVTKPLHTAQLHLLVDQMIAHCTDDVKDLIQKNRKNQL